MMNNLKVIKPFGTMEPGDTFELSENGNYVSKNEWETDGEDTTMYSSIKQVVEISKDYAKMLVSTGYLSEKVEDKNFVNVFDEIEKLIDTYSSELESLDKDYENQPACLKVEKETVLSNMVKVLDHLHSLKK